MTKHLPLYLLHDIKNIDREKHINKIFQTENINTYINVTEFNEHDTSYDVYLDHFRANILDFSYRTENISPPYIHFSDYTLSANQVSMCMKYKWALSHFWQSSHPVCVILPDNVHLENNFVNNLNAAVSQAPSGWDLINISNKSTKPSSQNIENVTGLVWSRIAAGKILGAWQHYKICMKIEQELGFWFKQTALQVFDTPTPLVTCNT